MIGSFATDSGSFFVTPWEVMCMESPFSIIGIGARLESLAEFSGSAGVILIWNQHIFSYPVGRVKRPRGDFDTVGDKISSLTEQTANIKIIPLRNGRLLFLEPSQSVAIDDRTLRFLGEELEKEIELTAVFDSLSESSVIISSNLNLHEILHNVMRLSEAILDIEISAVLLLDPEKRELYWEVSRGYMSEQFEKRMRLPLGMGIGGHVAQTGKPMLVKDVLKEPRWCPEYDQRTGSHTKSLMCVPIKFHGEILGVIEVINKKQGEFTPKDLRILEIIAAQTGGAIENARIHGELESAYEELKSLDKAKERVLNHLSHELGTPLSIIKSCLKILSRKINQGDMDGLESKIERGMRSTRRLIELQYKISDIVSLGAIPEEERVTHLIEDALGIVEEIKDGGHGEYVTFILNSVSDRLRSLRCPVDIRMTEIRLEEFLTGVCEDAMPFVRERHLNIEEHFEEGVVLTMDKGVLSKVCQGLLKNAIENTPDGGKIDIQMRSTDKGVMIHFRDYGVGITVENQKRVFGGFFHTQDTSKYSSGKPYAFNAGGTGADLLRMKAFSERLGFKLDFESARCRFIPEDGDACKGSISSCPFISHPSECFSSGGSVFTLLFPNDHFVDLPFGVS